MVTTAGAVATAGGAATSGGAVVAAAGGGVAGGAAAGWAVACGTRLDVDVARRRAAAASLATTGWSPGRTGRCRVGLRRRSAMTSQMTAAATWSQAIQAMVARTWTTKSSLTPDRAASSMAVIVGTLVGRGQPTAEVS